MNIIHSSKTLGTSFPSPVKVPGWRLLRRVFRFQSLPKSSESALGSTKVLRMGIEAAQGGVTSAAQGLGLAGVCF